MLLNFRKLLRFLKIVQTVNNHDRSKQGLKKLGRGYSKSHRLNPYNPLSYLTVIITIIVGTILFGITGFWKEVDHRNPFKWD